jgi:hypothetical protein
VGRTHADANLHVSATRDERLEDRPVGPGHFVGCSLSFRRAGERGRVRGGAGVGSMRREHAEMHDEHHRSPRHQDDDRVEGQQLTAI